MHSDLEKVEELAIMTYVDILSRQSSGKIYKQPRRPSFRLACMQTEIRKQEVLGITNLPTFPT
jgi:hypothetical protein